MKPAERLLELADISDNISKGLKAIKDVRGLQAFILACILFFINWQLWPLIWYLDIGPTQLAGERFTPLINSTLHTTIDPVTGGVTMLGVLLLPTLLEMTAPLFARNGNGVAHWIWWSAICIDLWTDFPNVRAIVQSQQETFATMGIWGGFLAQQIAQFCLLLLATLFLELWFASTMVIAAVLLFQAFIKPKKEEPAAQGPKITAKKAR